MSVHTRSQKLAQAAYQRITQRKPEKIFDDYVTFAKKFPALIHTCGLAQAVAFATTQKERGMAYLQDLAEVLRASGHPGISDAGSLEKQTRNGELSAYLRLSRDAIHAASWLKRYAEAAGGSD